MKDKISLKINGTLKDFEIKKEGEMKILKMPIEIKVEEGSFLHIGASPSPLTEKKGSIFKVDRTPVIPATSFKGALRHQLELFFIENSEKLSELFEIPNDNKELLKPCIPAPKPTKAEKELIDNGKYRKYNCEVKVDENNVKLTEDENKKEIGICPVCYFMGSAGIMGFLRFNNFYPDKEESIIDQTNIRIDRKTYTAAHGAKVDGEHVKPGTVFKGDIEIVLSDPILEMQGLQFGDARKIGNKVIDKWLENWSERDKTKKVGILIEKILIPALENIRVLGGYKSKGAGKVKVSIL